MKIHKEMTDRWHKYASLLLAEHGYSLGDVKTKVDAWNIAHTLGITREAYHIDRSVKDTHIETALRHIFPNMPR